MVEIHSLKPRAAVEEAASSWIARLEADDVTDADRQQCRVWLNSHPMHQDVFRDMRRTWHRLDALAQTEPAGDSLGHAYDWRRRRPIAWASAASVALAIVVGWLLTTSTPESLRYETEVGEQVVVTLSDGSSIDLNTNSLLEVSYTSAQRSIDLVRGEAHFNVEKDPDRPFVVRAGNGLIRAVGTAFNVYIGEEAAVEVTVTEGIVEVLSSETAPAGLNETGMKAARIRQNQRISYDAGRVGSGTVTAVPVMSVDRQLAWRHGMLSFDGQPLEVVIREVSRYTDVKFVFADEELRAVQVGGYFRATDTDALLELLQTALGIESRRDGDRIILHLAQG